MHRFRMLACLLVVGAMASVAVYSQTGPATNTAVIYEGARLIVGDAATPPLDDGAFVVQNGLITAIGRRGAVTAPAGATRVDLTGKTVMPALINVHAHLGYEQYTSVTGDSQSEHYTAENLLDHFQREAFYGVGTVNDGGTAVVPISLQFQMDQEAGQYPSAARYVFNAGITPPHGGPDELLIEGTRPLNANYEVITAREARAVVQDLAALGITRVKVWLGDRNGTYPAMPHEVYDAIIDEARMHNISVHAHALIPRDQKDALRAGADLIVHFVRNQRLDDELIALIGEKKPYWMPSIGGDSSPEICANDPFATGPLPATLVAEIQAYVCDPDAPPPSPFAISGPVVDAATREEISKANFQAMLAAGARIVLGTDAGIRPVKTFGSSEHGELATFVRLGMSTAQAIEAGTALAAEALGLDDVGRLATGTQADFLVLDANPLDDILNTRRISAVYLRGAKLDRDAMLAKWNEADAAR